MKRATKPIRVVIIQGYNTPYRNQLFNEIAAIANVDLTLLYISKRGENRKWTEQLVSRFREVQVACRTEKLDYEESKTVLNYLDFARQILRLKPDVVVSQLCKYTIIIKYLLFWKKFRLVHWSEATLVVAKGVNWFNKAYLRWHFNLPSAFVFPGRLAREYHEFCGLPLEKGVFYAPNSVDAVYSISRQELHEKFARAEPLKFLFVGSFVERKGFHLLNKAYGTLRKKGYQFEFHVAGAGPLAPVEGIIAHGFVGMDEALSLYSSCHVFVIPSLADCNPLSLIEAAKLGNVLLASKGCGNYPEIVDGNGFVFEIDDEESLVCACEAVLSKSSEELFAMGTRSIELSSAITHENSAKAFGDAIRYAHSYN